MVKFDQNPPQEGFCRKTDAADAGQGAVMRHVLGTAEAVLAELCRILVVSEMFNCSRTGSG